MATGDRTGSINADKYGISQKFGVNPSYYAKYGYKGHPGVDTKQRQGQYVYSETSKAKCVGSYSAAQGGSAGQYLVFKTSLGQTWRYLHLSSRFAKVGKWYKRGDAIGRAGNTGDSTAAHLHFDYRPRIYNPWNGYGGRSDPMKKLSVYKK